MIVEPITAFGCIGTQCIANANEPVLPFLLQKQYKNGWYFYYEGHSQHLDPESKDVISDRVAGWVGIDTIDYGAEHLESITYVKDTKWVHFPSEFNQHNPTITPLVCAGGKKTKLANLSDMYLVEGTLTINEREITAPAQIRVRSGDVVAHADTDVVALLFS